MSPSIRTLSLMLLLAGSLLQVGTVQAGASASKPRSCRLDAPDAASAGEGCARAWMDRNLKMNDVTTVGTHNSYKQAIPPADYALFAKAAPKIAQELDYAHKSLTAELDAGARQLEIDVVYDPQGGRYAHPAIARQTGTALPADWTRLMEQPGFKVLHVPDLDFRSSCVTFRRCLGEIKAWSQRHPDHAPIMILVNAKDGNAVPGGVPLIPFDEAAFDAFDAEIRSVLPAHMLVTPDDVQGRYATLREAVLAGNWPKLGDARGKLYFALDENEAKVAAYRGTRQALEGRVAFVNTDESSPAAAYLTLNNPVTQGVRIAADVKAGFIVRTRADDNTWQARSNDVAHRAAALASGAQAVSTDYLWADPRFPGGFAVRLPGHVAAQCNVIRMANRCAGLPVEEAGARDLAAAQAAPMLWPAPRVAERQP
ncbi:phosphatidylinositol-specific phospholipase C1-like protein [Novosphingobium sp. KA1]|uniref:phosphatidylinositol-specific phospholipase C1-like protein n=1 Tax=Novosphingobium sp. (strain KA1) TaxID=164608 RepID=UPI001A8DDA6B|nr:phosphatidylinositol-specific phospholipase C1-like protein [Novosphingobium sp. KA1]